MASHHRRRPARLPRPGCDTRAVITLGTPFHGSVLAVSMLRRTRRSRCYRTGSCKPWLSPPRRIRSAADLPMPGGRRRRRDSDTRTHRRPRSRIDLARRALIASRTRRDTATALPGHRPAVGIAQPPLPASASPRRPDPAHHTTARTPTEPFSATQTPAYPSAPSAAATAPSTAMPPTPAHRALGYIPAVTVP